MSVCARVCFATSLQLSQVTAASSHLYPISLSFSAIMGSSKYGFWGLTDCSSLYQYHLQMGQTPEGHPKEQGTT